MQASLHFENSPLFFSQSKNHYGRQMWYPNDQKSVKFNVAVIVC